MYTFLLLFQITFGIINAVCDSSVCVCVEHTKWGRYSTVVNSSPRHFLTTTKLYHLNECSGGKITNQVVAHKISRVKENFGVKKCLTENLTLSYILTKVLFQK